MNTLGDYDRWFKPCSKCGYDSGRAGNNSPARCWRCVSSLERDFTPRALKSNRKLFEAILDISNQAVQRIKGGAE